MNAVVLKFIFYTMLERKQESAARMLRAVQRRAPACLPPPRRGQALLLFRRPLGGTALGILGGCFLCGPARLVGALVGGRFGLVVVRHGRHFGGWFAG